MVESTPATALIVPQAQFLLQFLVRAGSVETEYLAGSDSPRGDSMSNHSSGSGSAFQ
jgi:hypothetical protein